MELAADRIQPHNVQKPTMPKDVFADRRLHQGLDNNTDSPRWNDRRTPPPTNSIDMTCDFFQYNRPA